MGSTAKRWVREKEPVERPPLAFGERWDSRLGDRKLASDHWPHPSKEGQIL